MRPSPVTLRELRPELPPSWGEPYLGVPVRPIGPSARLGVNWTGDESLDRLITEVGKRQVLGCAIFEGFKPGAREKIIRVDVWVTK